MVMLRLPGISSRSLFSQKTAWLSNRLQVHSLFQNISSAIGYEKKINRKKHAGSFTIKQRVTPSRLRHAAKSMREKPALTHLRKLCLRREKLSAKIEGIKLLTWEIVKKCHYTNAVYIHLKEENVWSYVRKIKNVLTAYQMAILSVQTRGRNSRSAFLALFCTPSLAESFLALRY